MKYKVLKVRPKVGTPSLCPHKCVCAGNTID